jgi:hypothetical protein
VTCFFQGRLRLDKEPFQRLDLLPNISLVDMIGQALNSHRVAGLQRQLRAAGLHLQLLLAGLHLQFRTAGLPLRTADLHLQRQVIGLHIQLPVTGLQPHLASQCLLPWIPCPLWTPWILCPICSVIPCPICWMVTLTSLTRIDDFFSFHLFGIRSRLGGMDCASVPRYSRSL